MIINIFILVVAIVLISWLLFRSEGESEDSINQSNGSDLNDSKYIDCDDADDYDCDSDDD